MNGNTMIARIRPAVSMPMRRRTLEQRREHRHMAEYADQKWLHILLQDGANMNRPQMP